MTKDQFETAMRKLGFSDSHLEAGYWRMPAPHHRIHVPVSNGGQRWDDRLAYACKMLRDEDDKAALRQNLNAGL